MSWTVYQVDAFADRPFSGNPAGVCLLDRAAPEEWMQAVAAEMNVAETAFLVPRDDGGFDLTLNGIQRRLAAIGENLDRLSHLCDRLERIA